MKQCWFLWNEEDLGLKQKEMQMQKETLVIRGQRKTISLPAISAHWTADHLQDNYQTNGKAQEKSPLAIPCRERLARKIIKFLHLAFFFLSPFYFIGYS